MTKKTPLESALGNLARAEREIDSFGSKLTKLGLGVAAFEKAGATKEMICALRRELEGESCD